MNDKITFPRLATLLADRSGRSKRFSEDFLREFFALISERLEAGESVKIKGLGTFRLSRVEPRRSVDVTTGQPMEISGHSKVVFVPAKELADAVNSPFEAFTAIEISDDADLSQIFAKDEIELHEASEDFQPDTDIDIAVENTDEIPSVKIEQPTYATPIVSPQKGELDPIEPDEIGGENDEAPEMSETAEPTAECQNEEPQETPEAPEENHREEQEFSESTEQYITEESQEQEEILDQEHDGRKKRRRILLISMVAVVIALFATGVIWYVYATDDFHRIFHMIAPGTNGHPQELVAADSSETQAAALSTADDTISDLQGIEEENEVPTAPSDAVVYDTISTTRFLTTMARAHYGNYNLWPYIYEENKAILGHPDRIRPGTPVVIPKLSKYGIDPTNNDDVEKAKKLGVEIYARYGKKI